MALVLNEAKSNREEAFFHSGASKNERIWLAFLKRNAPVLQARRATTTILRKEETMKKSVSNYEQWPTVKVVRMEVVVFEKFDKRRTCGSPCSGRGMCGWLSKLGSVLAAGHPMEDDVCPPVADCAAGSATDVQSIAVALSVEVRARVVRVRQGKGAARRKAAMSVEISLNERTHSLTQRGVAGDTAGLHKIGSKYSPVWQVHVSNCLCTVTRNRGYPTKTLDRDLGATNSIRQMFDS
uniref:Uncharacterized protein n=1 Tax=Globodera rostochiensis TaxID=31243 RepID=A0A914HNW9_GLORO